MSSPGSAALDADNVEPNSIFSAAMAYCKKRRAFLIIDPPPEVRDVPSAVDWITDDLPVHDLNGAAYFPRLKLRDPLNDFQMRVFAPCGVVAGLYSRIDVARGVWKAPAGTEASKNSRFGALSSMILSRECIDAGFDADPRWRGC